MLRVRCLPGHVIVLLGLLCCLSPPAIAETKASSKEDNTTEVCETQETVSTSHALQTTDGELSYTATAQEMLVSSDATDATGKVFFVAYERDAPAGDAQNSRPVTFAFNGGPGASAVWLHMGVMGPARVTLGEQGQVPPPPVGYEPNPLSWLRFTDLVFVDPVGTGFSHSDDAKHSSDADAPQDKNSKSFWGVEQDVQHMAAFIRLYLNRNKRWDSPVYLVGESYGTTRAAALSLELLESEGIALSGLVLVSPVLDFNTLMASESNLPYALFLPSYAATARLHGKGFAGKGDLAKELLEVEDYIAQEYLPDLFMGDALQEEARKELVSRVASFTGLPENLVRQQAGRVPSWLFFKHLLADKRLLVGRMDGSVTGVDPEPGAPYPAFDPSLDGLLPAFSSAFNAYVRQELDYDSDLSYQLLNPEVERNWDWKSGLKGRQGYVLTSDELRQAMSVNPHMRVWLATGYYDLATPYFASIYTLRQMDLAPELRDNVRLDVYHGGHMLYTHQQAREAFCKDAAAFYADSSQ